MHGSRTAGRDLLPFALALWALALAFYVVAVVLVGRCDPANSAEVFLVAGGLCIAVAVALGFLNGYRHDHRKPDALDWVGIIVFSMAAGAGAGFCALFVCAANAPWFAC